MKILEKGVMIQPGDDPSVIRKMMVGEKFIFKGDVAGHDFHGNQWTGGGGAASDHAYNAMKESGVLNKRDGVKSNLTRKHFESVAMSLKRVPDEHRAEATRIAAQQLKTSNPLFNSERFSNAVEGRGSKAPGRMGHTSSTAAGIRQSARDMGRNAPEPKDRFERTEADKQRLRDERNAGLGNIDLRRW